MMAKIHSGQGFAGLVDYANDIKNKDTNIIASEGVDLTSNKSIVASFSLQAKSRPSLKNFVGHISLSFAPEDSPRLSDKLMSEIAREYLRRMGIVNMQFIMCRHHDKPHGHVHIVYNRVDNDGNALTKDQGFRKSARITQALTREYGLTFGKGKKKVNRDRLKGKDVIKYRIYDAVSAALKECRSMEVLRKALSAQGISMEIVRNAEGNAKGITFSNSNVSFAGYQIDRSMTYTRLCQTMGVVQANDNGKISQSASDNQMTHQSFSFGGQHADTMEKTGVQQGTATVESVGDTGSSDAMGGDTSSGVGIGAAITELVMQPHVVPSSGGGGSSNDRGWNDDDKEKKKNPYKRRR